VGASPVGVLVNGTHVASPEGASLHGANEGGSPEGDKLKKTGVGLTTSKDTVLVSMKMVPVA
jgi:hypothetical protein